MNTIQLPVYGVDMMSDETQMPRGTARAVANVDLGRSGEFRRRAGYTSRALAGALLTGMTAFAGRLLVGCGTWLNEVNPQTFELTPVCDMGSEHLVEFTEYNGWLYAVSPQSLWRVPVAGAARKVGVAPPAVPYALPHNSGTLTPGRYGVAVTMLDDLGEESPAYFLGTHKLTTGLQMVGLPTDGAKWRVYLTPPDGDLLYLAEEFEAYMPEHIVTVYPNGAPCATLHLQPMPGGDFVRGHGGRLYVASRDTLWYSEALRPHLTHKGHNFVRFVGAIRFIELTEGGAYVGDDRGVWWLAGEDPTKWDMHMVSDAVAVRRSSLMVPGRLLPENKANTNSKSDDCAVWLSSDGYMLGTASGNVSALQPNRIRLDPSIEGRSSLLTRDGTTQVITLTAASAATVFGVALDSATTH